MADSFRTDEETAEAIKKWLRENGSSLLTGILLGLAVLFGSRAWFAYQDQKAAAASNHYTQLAMAVEQGNMAAASGKHEAIIKDHPDSTYAVLAALQIARLHTGDGNMEAAAAQLEWAFEQADQPNLKHIARIRLVRLLIGQGQLERADALLTGMPTSGPYGVVYLELNGDLALAQGEHRAARAAYDKALEIYPPEVPGRALLEAKRDDAVRGHSVSPS